MAKIEHRNLKNIQRMFEEPDFVDLCGRLKQQFFEQWQRERKLDERERIHAKLDALDQLLTDMRSAADSIAYEKQRSS